jgi:hypothetical protein
LDQSRNQSSVAAALRIRVRLEEVSLFMWGHMVCVGSLDPLPRPPLEDSRASDEDARINRYRDRTEHYGLGGQDTRGLTQIAAAG